MQMILAFTSSWNHAGVCAGPPTTANGFMSMTFCASAWAAVASVGPPVASIVSIFSVRPYVS